MPRFGQSKKRRFSKLKKRIESFFAPELDLRVYCTVLHYSTTHWEWDDPRFWIVLDKETIFDFIKDFKGMHIYDEGIGDIPIYYELITEITDIIHEYIETPTGKLFDCVFQKDIYGLSDILKAADRRIGKKTLLLLKDRTDSEAVKKIIDARLSNGKGEARA